MVFQMPEREGPAYRVRGRRWSRRLVAAAAGALVLLAGCAVLAGGWTEWLWYRSVGYGSVFGTRLKAEAGLFAGFGLLMAAATVLNGWLAHRLRPPLAAMSPEQRGLDRCRARLAPVRRRLLAVGALLTGAAGGAAAAGQWRQWLLWRHATPFGVRDGQFHRDVSFYAFDLPWYRFLVDFGFGLLVVSALAAVLVHYLYGGLRLQGPGRRVGTGAQGHLAVLMGGFVLLEAASYWLDRYALAVRGASWHGIAGYTGLRFTDARAHLPADTVLCCAAVICAVLFLLTPVRRTWLPAMLGFGLMLLSAVLVGGLYPAIVQQLEVAPHEQAKEAPYLRQNIEATRQAYGLAGVTAAGPAPAAPDARTVAAVPLSGPAGGPPADPDPAGPGWTAEHLRDTHDYGVADAAGSGPADASGQPAVTESAQPPDGAGAGFEQRVYYGERTTGYAVVGGGGEADYAPGYRYRGGSGVALDGPLVRAAFAVRFGEPRFLSTGSVGGGSRVLYDRTPAQRVAKAAPWLTLDSDPYPVTVGGRLLWVLDGYTTSDDYPFSSRTALGGGAAVNYVRDAVKATVDAYTGAVVLYQWDEQDPVLRTWMKAFPGTVEPRAAIPAGLLAHLRYPRDLFEAQRELLGAYHVTDPAAFAAGTDRWQVPPDPAGGTGPQPPAYLTVRMPGAPAAAFSLTGTLVAAGRGDLAAYLAVDSEPGPDYGALRLLRPADGSGALGPGQEQAAFTADPAVAGWLNRQHQDGAAVAYGSLLTLPVGGGFLAVEPVYTTGPGDRSPVLRKVLAVYGTGPVAVAADLPGALDSALAGSPAAPPPGGDPALRKALDDLRTAYAQSQDAFAAGDRAGYARAEQALRAALDAATAAENGGPPPPQGR
ncbi:UPF0182 family protein [Kitasatospora sp. NPDC006697]|uniref:UPF0182 family protein n=1 Tax=Kitasatospora sp. NPDC006697 TaxID=3364020 RepID=UPI0036B3A88E